MSHLTRTRSDLARLLAASLDQIAADHLPTVALLGQLMGPDVALERRLGLLTTASVYLHYCRPDSPWAFDRQLSDTHDAVVWTDPSDELLIDLPRGVDSTDPLLDDTTRDHARGLIEHDHGVHRLAAIRVIPLQAPTRSVALLPQLPLRPYPLLEGPHAYGLTTAEIPPLRKENR